MQRTRSDVRNRTEARARVSKKPGGKKLRPKLGRVIPERMGSMRQHGTQTAQLWNTTKPITSIYWRFLKTEKWPGKTKNDKNYKIKNWGNNVRWRGTESWYANGVLWGPRRGSKFLFQIINKDTFLCKKPFLSSLKFLSV